MARRVPERELDVIESAVRRLPGGATATDERPVAGSGVRTDTERAAAVSLSPGGAGIRAYLRQPAAARRPAGYRREFLDTYLPNVSFHLSPAQRSHLGKVGRSTVTAEPAGTYARRILDRLLIDLSWNSSRLEGNTYTLLDTRRLIEFARRVRSVQVAPPRRARHDRRRGSPPAHEQAGGSRVPSPNGRGRTSSRPAAIGQRAGRERAARTARRQLRALPDQACRVPGVAGRMVRNGHVADETGAAPSRSGGPAADCYDRRGRRASVSRSGRYSAEGDAAGADAEPRQRALRFRAAVAPGGCRAAASGSGPDTE